MGNGLTENGEVGPSLPAHDSYFQAHYIRLNWACSIFDSQNQVLLKWSLPPCDVLKLNIDGSRLSHNGSIAAGGLIRNSDGDWVCGFSANLGVGDIHVAELWALCNGLKMAAGQNVTHILVESDSAVVVNLVKGE